VANERFAERTRVPERSISRGSIYQVFRSFVWAVIARVQAVSVSLLYQPRLRAREYHERVAGVRVGPDEVSDASGTETGRAVRLLDE